MLKEKNNPVSYGSITWGDEENGMKVSLVERLSRVASNVSERSSIRSGRSDRSCKRSLVDNAAMAGFEGTGTLLNK